LKRIRLVFLLEKTSGKKIPLVRQESIPKKSGKKGKVRRQSKYCLVSNSVLTNIKGPEKKFILL